MHRKKTNSSTKVLLPSHVRPERYQLTITPDMVGCSFGGEEVISVVLDKPTKKITLHAKDLKVTMAKAEVGRKSIPCDNIIGSKKNENITLLFTTSLPAGRAKITLHFHGVLNDQMCGFYRSSYTHKNNEKHLATTQFEATDARRAFPCFDEPAHRAVFEVTLKIPKHAMAVSNTIETSVVEHNEGYKIVKFAPTPKMSTYLLAFIVGELEYIEGKTKRGVPVRVFTTPGKKHRGQFALDTAIRCLEFFEDYFNIPYPMPTLDLIAIPDFQAMAMENWGAVTYRESALLIDPAHSSAGNKQTVAIVIAHELAHQWFGNLVTMRWWTDLWLNEGFASYMEYLAVDALFPKWEMWTQFVSGSFAQALKLDGLKSTHPIEIEVGHPDEINEIFDAVSYSKGASVIRMLAGYLGQDIFKKGLRYYLKKHSYGNTVTKDLWQAFEYVSKKPISRLMESWTKQAGHPIVETKINELAGKFVLQISQSRFVAGQSDIKKNSTALWPIPVTMREIENGREVKILLKEKTTSIALPPGMNAKKIVVNAGQIGFFRVKYGSNMLEQLSTAVKLRQISAIDRIGLVRDLFALAESGHLNISVVLEFLLSFRDDDEYGVWLEISSGLIKLNNLLFAKAGHKSYQALCRSLLSILLNRIGWKNKTDETHTRGLLRSLVLETASVFSDKEVNKTARQLFSAALKNGKPVPPNIRSVVYNSVVRQGGLLEFTLFSKMYGSTGSPEERDRIGRALGCFNKKTVINKVLNFAMSSNVRRQDTPMLLASMLANPAAREEAWKFIRNHWDELLERYGGGLLLDKIVGNLRHFTATKELKNIKLFFRNHKAPAAERSLKQAIEGVETNITRLKRDYAKINIWLTKQTKK